MKQENVCGKTLVIVESPSKCKTVTNILGKGYVCVASKGHIREVDTKAFNIKNWKDNDIPYKIIKRQYSTVSMLKKMILYADDVILATDCDREGESIAWHICNLFNLPLERTKRLRFSEITKSAITSSIRCPSIVDMNVVDAQKTRQLLDLVIGYTVSPVLWKYIGVFSKKSLSAGRCQTPALKLIYEHYKKERNYYDNKDNLQIHHKVVSTFQLKDHNDVKQFTAKLNKPINDTSILSSFMDQSKIFKSNIISSKLYKREAPAYTPLITTTLQQRAGLYLHFSPKQTMKLAQTLYEKGHITYMRTDNPSYSNTFTTTLKSYIKSTYGVEYVRDKIYIGKRKTKSQDAHEAIRPTKIDVTTVMTNNERKLYSFIRNHTLKTCITSTKYDCLKIELSAPNKLTYCAAFENMTFDGFQIISKEKDNEDILDASYKLDNISYHDMINVVKSKDYVNILRVHTQSSPECKAFSPRFTESSIIRELESLGIGRPSTYTNIIETIQTREYVEKQDVTGVFLECTEFSLFDSNSEVKTNMKKMNVGEQTNKLSVTNLGYIVCDYLYKSPFQNIFDYTYTKNMESQLDNIENGSQNMGSFLSAFHSDFQEKIDEISSSKIQKFKVQLNPSYVYTYSRYGETIQNIETKESFGLKNNNDFDLHAIYENNSSHLLTETIESLQDRSKQSSGTCIGIHPELQTKIYVKCGPYGHYLQYEVNNKKKSISLKNLPEEKIISMSLDFAISIIKSENEKREKQLENYIELSEHMTIRKSKYGKYVYYKTNTMKKPKFLSLKGCPFDIEKINNKNTPEIISEKSAIVEWLQEYKLK